MRPVLRSSIVMLVAWSALLASCDSRKASPAGPTPASNPAAVKLDIVGANRIDLGTKTQLVAQLTLADGSKKDCGTLCNWRVQDAQIAAVSNGFVLALAPGQTTVFAAYAGSESSIAVTVVPANTYVLDGIVKEPGDLPIDTASVEIVGGHDAGKKTTSTGAGYFVFFGVSGTLQLNVSKPGYVTQTIPLTLTHDITRDVELQPVLPIGALGGDYRLTLKAEPGCKLPAEAMTREYLAHIAQSGARLDVTLSGAGLSTSEATESFSGHVSGNQVTFDLPYDGYYGIYSFVDKVSDTLYVVVYGEATGEGQGGTIRSTLDGTIATYQTLSRAGTPTAMCRGSHQMTFVTTSVTSQRR